MACLLSQHTKNTKMAFKQLKESTSFRVSSMGLNAHKFLDSQLLLAPKLVRKCMNRCICRLFLTPSTCTN